jgi:hypothetical protein
MISNKSLIIASFSLLFSIGCYSFRGITIPPTIDTFYVDQFQLNVGNAPPDLGQQFSERLRDIILNSSRLSYNETTPQIEFTGAIREFSVTSVAPQRNGEEFSSALNRLQITVEVEYVNNEDDEDAWNQRFSFFQDFESEQVLNDVQDELITTIFDQITRDVFNRAFTNW